MFISSLAVASSVLVASALYVPRAPSVNTPANWWSGLEPYSDYSTRYNELGCAQQHNTSFFDDCCHPMLKGQDISSLNPECDPDNTCDGEDDGPETTTSTNAPAATSTKASSSKAHTSTAAPINVAPPPSSTTSSKESSPTPPAGNSSVIASGSGKGTFYTQNGVAGACGTVHSDSSKVVALDYMQYNSAGDCGTSSLCGKSIHITNTATGKSVDAIVADCCPTCVSKGSVDMSVGAFTELATEAQGEINISWTITN